MDTVQVRIVVPSPIWREVKAHAALEGISSSTWVRLAVSEKLERYQRVVEDFFSQPGEEVKNGSH